VLPAGKEITYAKSTPESSSTEQICFEVNLDMKIRQQMLKEISLKSAERR